LVAILITELRFWGISFAILYSGQIVKVGAIIEVLLLSAALVNGMIIISKIIDYLFILYRAVNFA